LVENKELRKKLGKNARKTILKKYSLGMMADDYINYFQKIIK
jgi:glycosyltransferase involved in cell wall biosynthesis